MSIPSILFTYWEGKQLSYLHYLTIYSLYKLNPNRLIYIYTSSIESNKLIQWNSPEHTHQFKNIINFDKLQYISSSIKIIPIDFEKEYSILNSISIVYKADITRIIKLYEHGGMWFDFDILFIKPIPEYVFTKDYEFIYFSYENTIPTGLLFSTCKNKYISVLYHFIMDHKDEIENNNNYQYIGPRLWEILLPILNNQEDVLLLSTSDIYPYVWNNIRTFFNTNTNLVTENTWGIHWYNGDNEAKRAINQLNKDNIQPNKNVMEKYIHYILSL
jgi:hypothetical protein